MTSTSGWMPSSSFAARSSSSAFFLSAAPTSRIALVLAFLTPSATWRPRKPNVSNTNSVTAGGTSILRPLGGIVLLLRHLRRHCGQDREHIVHDHVLVLPVEIGVVQVDRLPVVVGHLHHDLEAAVHDHDR